MSGYEYDFVHNIPDRILCQICRLPCRDPQRSVCCGHVFCKSEIDQHQIREKSCPQCFSENFTPFVDKLLQREINGLSIYCPNKKDGCGWIGEIARIDDHVKECEISCSKCKQIVYFSTMRSHLDTECPCYCPYCDITAEREVISSEHKEKCHKFPITCPNNCSLDGIPRDDMDEHKKVCPLQMIQCEYQCGAVIARNEITQHDRLNLVTHVHNFKDELDRTMTSSLNRCTEAETNVASLFSSISKELDDIDIKLKPVDHVNTSALPHAKLQSAEIHNIISKANQKCVIPSFLRYGINLLLCLNCLLMNLFLLLLVQKVYLEYKKSISVPPVLTETDEKLSLTLSDLLFNCGFKKQPPSDSDVEYGLEYWRSSLGVKIVSPVILEMPDFDKYTVTNAEWYSSPFFAFEGGYVMCLRAYAAGTDDGKVTDVSAYLHLMKGPHDDKLEWPMRGQYAINLIDPTDQTCSLYYKIVHFDTRFADYNRITSGKRSYYGLGFAELIDLRSTTITALSNMTVVNSFLTKHNSLHFMISYYKA